MTFQGLHNLTTPPKLRLSIKLFLKKIGFKSPPIFLKFTKISDKYLPKYCLSNCEAESISKGNPTIHGWIIWEDKQNFLINAEFHTVAKINNKMVDITPRVDGEEKILFVPDNTRKAKRIDDKTWDTWSNFESVRGNIIKRTSQITLRDFQSNKIIT